MGRTQILGMKATIFKGSPVPPKSQIRLWFRMLQRAGFHSWIWVQTKHVDRFRMVKCQRTETWSPHISSAHVIWFWTVRPWASPFKYPLDDLRIARSAVYLHLCQRISPLVLSSVFPERLSQVWWKTIKVFNFPLERRIWKRRFYASELRKFGFRTLGLR